MLVGNLTLLVQALPFSQINSSDGNDYSGTDNLLRSQYIQSTGKHGTVSSAAVEHVDWSDNPTDTTNGSVGEVNYISHRNPGVQ